MSSGRNPRIISRQVCDTTSPHCCSHCFMFGWSVRQQTCICNFSLLHFHNDGRDSILGPAKSRVCMWRGIIGLPVWGWEKDWTGDSGITTHTNCLWVTALGHSETMRLGECISYSGSLDPTGPPRDGGISGVSLVNMGKGYLFWTVMLLSLQKSILGWRDLSFLATNKKPAPTGDKDVRIIPGGRSRAQL